LKEYFLAVKESLPNNENIVMAEIAYRSFLKLAEGDVRELIKLIVC
jgi:hypothetical protein